MKLTKIQKERFNEVCQKAKVKWWKKEVLLICLEIFKDNKTIKSKDKEIVALRKVAKYILTGKK